MPAPAFAAPPGEHLSTFDAAGLCQDVISTMSQHAELNDLQLVADFPDDLAGYGRAIDGALVVSHSWAP